MSPKVIYIFGVGGIGGFIGSRMVQATIKNSNIKTYFIARGAHADAINKNGLTLETQTETIVTHPVLAATDLNDLPDPDLCILCVKSYDLEGACKKLKSKVHQATVIIPVLNGVDIYERMRRTIDVGYILPGCVYMNSFVKAPGTVTHVHNDLVIYGKDPQFPDYIPSDIIEFLNTIPNIRFQFKEDPYPAIWEKYMFVAAYALVTAYSARTIRSVYENTELRKYVTAILNEIRLIANRKGYVFSENIVEELAVRGGRLPADALTSYQRDLALKDGRNEGDIFGETIIRMGKELKVPVPVTSKIYNEILVINRK